MLQAVTFGEGDMHSTFHPHTSVSRTANLHKTPTDSARLPKKQSQCLAKGCSLHYNAFTASPVHYVYS